MSDSSLRSHFPILRHTAYLNAGTCGPMPATVTDAACSAIAAEVAEGRMTEHFDIRKALFDELRELYAQALGAAADDVSLTNSTSEGLGRVLGGMDLGPGDEILTSDEEHIGVIGPLIALRQAGVSVRTAPLANLHEHVSARTTLVVCCHVGWISGRIAPAELRETGVPVIFDGAQSVGAVPLDMSSLGCAAFAGAGQKWLCGADGTGMLYTERGFRERVRNVSSGYLNFEDANAGLDSPLKATAARLDTGALNRETLAASVASTRLLVGTGLQANEERAIRLAGELAERLAAAGRTVAARDATTLVAWEDDDPVATRARLAEAGVVVRDVPNTPYLRASVGAWNDSSDLDRLLEAL